MMNLLSTLALVPAAPAAQRPFLDIFQDPDLALAFLARLHPLLVHFPIALFIVAALAEILRPNRQSEKPTKTAFACVTLGAILGGLAAWSGWVHAELHPPVARVAETVKLHRWTGVGVSGLGLLAFLTGALAHVGSMSALTRIYRAAIVLAGLGVGFSAHLGATLIYGEGYLTEVFEQPATNPATSPGPAGPSRPAPTTPEVEPGPAEAIDIDPATLTPEESGATAPNDVDVPNGVEEPEAPSETLANLGAIETLEESLTDAPMPVSFERDVMPIFVENCIDCHGPRKRKGGLRLDAEQFVFSGDPDFWVIERGNADASELVRLIELPADDPDIMPARGDRLSDQQIALVRRWIDEGADFGGASVGEIAVPAATPPGDVLQDETSGTQDVEAEPAHGSEEPEAKVLGDVEVEDPVARAATLTALEESGVWARPVAIGWNALDVDFRRRADLGDETLAQLAPVANQVTALDLTGSGVTAAGLEHLSDCDHLEFLVLRDTNIGDDAVASLAMLPALERLNLVGTDVGDAGALELAQAPKLRRVFVWNSAITSAGVEALQAERPELEIITGD